MRIRLVKRRTILEEVADHRWDPGGFLDWFDRLNSADWTIPSDMLTTFNSADILGRGSQRVVFNIGGNKYRLICRYYFGKRFVHLYVCWLGTHSAYDKLCRQNMQYAVSDY